MIKQVLNTKINHKIPLNFKEYCKPYTFFKNEYNPIMPLKIFQTWHTKDLPPKMKERVEELKTRNPKFEHYLFDDNDCYEFIKNNFNSDVLNAYTNLIPGAYRADLWRLCVLYIHGGIYLDIKVKCINGFKLIELTERNHFVLDSPEFVGINFPIYNAVIACEKNHPFLLMGINKIVENVKNKFYGPNALWPTGPAMLGDLITKNNIKLNIDLKLYTEAKLIIYNNRFIFSTIYDDYYADMNESYKNNNKNVQHYHLMWLNKNIYC